MNFGFTEEQELLRKTARDILAEQASMKRVREFLEGPQRYSRDLWKRMAELGWLGLAFPENVGGAGLSMVELSSVLEELGRTLAPVPFLPTMLAGCAVLEAGDDAQRRAWLPDLCGGRAIATLAITEERGSEEPDAIACTATRAGSGWQLRGRKLFVPDADLADWFVVAARIDAGPGLGLFCVPRNAAGISIESMKSMDLLRQLQRIEFAGTPLPESALLSRNTDAWPRLARVLDRGRVMICAEMVGGAEKCLEDSVQYAKQRIQFGKPIGVNQAIKHKCADMLFEVESAKSITYYAAWAAREDNAEAPLAAAMAKAYVSDAYRHASAENIQIHGGVGFTWEYDCHLYFKRAKSDEAWLGDGSHHRERVAQMLEL
jgi:alkylation response protein AidB-like acyl-CoA dehydrogenase